jgi:hypothetical protein
MIYARIDYPTSHITIHRDPGCRHVAVGTSVHRRKIRLDANTFSTEVKKVSNGDYWLGSGGGLDILWLQVAFGDQEFELAVVRFVQRILARRYKPIREAKGEVCGDELRRNATPR